MKEAWRQAPFHCRNPTGEELVVWELLEEGLTGGKNLKDVVILLKNNFDAQILPCTLHSQAIAKAPTPAKDWRICVLKE